MSCVVSGCDGPSIKGYFHHGYCQRHYRRLRLYGDPMTPDLRFVPGASVEAAQALRRKGWATTAIAARLGVSERHARRLVSGRRS